MQELIKHPRNERINFDHIEHKYTVDGSEVYRGVTSWISEYSKPFNPQKIANKLSKMYGVPAQDYLDEWERLRAYGDFVHDSIELYVNHGIKSDSSEFKSFELFLEVYNLEVVASELVIFDEEFKRASAVDLVCRNKTTGKLVVVDIKTREKEIERKAYKDARLSVPLNTLPDTRFHKYSLQIGIYIDWLRRLYDADVESTGIILNIYSDQWDVIHTQDVSDEVKALYDFTRNID